MSKANDQRRYEIEKLLYQNEKVTVINLAKQFLVSAETIRNDLAFLESKGIIYRSHGGASLRGANIDLPMAIRNQENTQIKKAIAQACIPYIKDDMIIYIDPSSTALYLGKLLRLRKNITVITNSYELVTLLSESNHRILILGGEFNKNGKRTVGEFTYHMIDHLYFDLCIFGMDGCKNIDGPANMIGDETLMNAKIMERSKQCVLLSDASKFNKYAHYQYATFNQFDLMITNKLSLNDKNKLSINKIIEIETEKEYE